MDTPRSKWLGSVHSPIRRLWRAWRYRRLPGWQAGLVRRERVEAETIAVCIGALNRSGPRIEYLLRSLRGQRLPESCIDITICDLGSGPAHLEDLRARCRAHHVRLICLHAEQPVWSRARAINIAVKHSNPLARYILPTDLDLVFSADFIEAVLRTHLALKDRAFVISDALDLPPEALDAVDDPIAKFQALKAQAVYRDCLGLGACQSAPRVWWHQVHGYDERLHGWGFEDDDLYYRARHSGLLPIAIDHRVDMLHQWHETDEEAMAKQGRTAEFQARYRENERLSRENPSVVRNPDGWGELPPRAEIIEPEGSNSTRLLIRGATESQV